MPDESKATKFGHQNVIYHNRLSYRGYLYNFPSLGVHCGMEFFSSVFPEGNCSSKF